MTRWHVSYVIVALAVLFLLLRPEPANDAARSTALPSDIPATAMFIQLCAEETERQTCRFQFIERVPDSDGGFTLKTIRDAEPAEAYLQIRQSEENWRQGGRSDEVYTVFTMYGNLGRQHPLAWQDYARLALELTGSACDRDCFHQYSNHALLVWNSSEQDERVRPALQALLDNGKRLIKEQHPAFSSALRYRSEVVAKIVANGGENPFVCSHLEDWLQQIATLEHELEGDEAELWSQHVGDALSTCHACPTDKDLLHYNPISAVSFYQSAGDEAGMSRAVRLAADIYLASVATGVEHMTDPCAANFARRISADGNFDVLIHDAVLYYLGAEETESTIDGLLVEAALAATKNGRPIEGALIMQHVGYAARLIDSIEFEPQPPVEEPAVEPGAAPIPEGQINPRHPNTRSI